MHKIWLLDFFIARPGIILNVNFKKTPGQF